MSILIKGMEMPTNDELLYIKIYPNGKVAIDMDLECKRIATAVSVPPHGRLIEKNAVFELIRSFPNVDRQLPVEFMKALYELPTILEDEETGEAVFKPKIVSKLVRCGDCKWFQCNMNRDGALPNGVPEYECRHWCGECDQTDFCSYAERRTE